MTTEIQIRKFEPGDEIGIRRLVDQVLRDEFPAEAEAFPTEDLADISENYGKLGEAFFVATRDGEIVGTVGIKQEDGRTALLRRLFVESGCRKQQLGGHLADRAIDLRPHGHGI